MKHLLNKIVPILKNKYVAVTVLFFIWVIFFDHNDLISEIKMINKIDRLKDDRTYYKLQTNQVAEQLKELQTNPANLEKFAREKYLMKKDNEDVYVIVDQNNKLLDTLNIKIP